MVVARSDQHVMIQSGTAIFVRYIKEAYAYVNMFSQMNVYYFMASAVCDKCYFIETNVYLKSPSLLLVRLWPQATIVLTPQVL